jgi:hypothetical protein
MATYFGDDGGSYGQDLYQTDSDFSALPSNGLVKSAYLLEQAEWRLLFT